MGGSRYSGWKVSKGWEVPVISNTIEPEVFFREYVLARKPVIIDGHITDPTWKGQLWDLEYMKEKAKNAFVQVEQRSSSQLGFGLAADKIDTTFGEFIDQIDTGSFYLTTQEIPSTSQGYEDLFAAPLNHLQSDFPLQPTLLGNLVPYQMNLWIGKAKNGSSSGLHHDYHDNLYILLSGRKQFRLFSPADARNVYVRGQVNTVHSNGLISYSDLPTRSDGANPVEVAAYETSSAEIELQNAEKDFERLETTGGTPEQMKVALERVQNAEERLDNAMEASLDVCEAENESDTEANESFHTGEEFPNFSKLTVYDLTGACKSTKKKFPKFNKATEVICNVKEGQMLYLPASWFHEVTSFTEGDKAHCAMNFWVYPPHTEKGTFMEPYEDAFWTEKWKQYLQKKNEQSLQGESQGPPMKRQKLK